VLTAFTRIVINLMQNCYYYYCLMTIFQVNRGQPFLLRSSSIVHLFWNRSSGD